MTALGQYPGKPNIVPYTAERPARMRQDPSKATRQYEKCGLGPLPSTPANSSRDALQLDSGGAVLRVSLRPRVANEPRGPPGRANLAPQPCIRLDPCGVRTMKKPFASAARLRAAGTFFLRHHSHG